MNQEASDPFQFQTVTVVSNEPDAVGLRSIVIEAPPSIIESYNSPGQYVQAKPAGEIRPWFFAMASPPGGDKLTFLVKETEGNKLFSKADPGSQFQMSLAQGKGFQIEEYFRKYKFDFPVTNILLLAAGTGLAPIAAAIDSGLLGIGKPNYNSLFTSKASLYVGCRTPEHMPLQTRVGRWLESGIRVIPVYSQATGAERKGYVQEALREDGIAVPRNTAALVCGHRPMVEDIRDQLLRAGVFEGRILLNF
jgi:NAD(P)H-flavin reductase